MTALTDLLGIELPIIQAPMAGVQDCQLTIAVSESGGLGSLPCAMLDLETLARELERINDETVKPYNVNFFCHKPSQPDAKTLAGWQTALRPYYREFGIDGNSVTTATSREPFCADHLAVLARFRPPVVSFHFGLPARELVAGVKGLGAKILASATTLEEAVWLERNGADAIIAQGLEAGGHRGSFLSDDLTRQMGTLALVPQVASKVKVPIIAAGGVATAREVAAALNLGALGVQVGTAYLLCHEAQTSSVHRKALQAGNAIHTAITNVFTGRPARSIVNRLIREVGPLSAHTPPFPLAAGPLAPIRAAAESEGRGDFSPLWAGQNASGCKAISAAELTRELGNGILDLEQVKC